MGDYNFIINNLTFSYSNIGTFNNCKYGWKLTYIDHVERGNNFYAEFGSFMHLVLEKYFRYEIDIFELTTYFQEHYQEEVTATPPAYPANIAEKYYESAVEFFDNFDFDRDKYEIIFIEDKLETEFHNVKIVVKPDLLLKDKETGEYMLVDYKTANPYDASGRLNKNKFAEFKKQLYLYAYFIWDIKKIEIKKIMIWMIRINKIEEFQLDIIEVGEVVEWFINSIDNIFNEDDFKPNNNNKFFCQNLCSVSQFCQYKP